MAFEPIVALEIGTTWTVVLVGESMDGQGGDIRIVGRGVKETAGVCKGLITEINQARVSVEEAVAAAAEASNTRIGLVHLAVSDGHIASDTLVGKAVIESPDATVTEDDMDAALEIIDAASVEDDRQILHRIPQFYTLDGKAGLPNPEGKHGRELEASALVIHGRRNHLDDAVAVARAANLDVRDTVFAGLMAAKAALTDEHKREGALLVHLGGGVTDYICFANGAPMLAASIPVGGDHVTNDIKLAFDLTTRQAEELKIANGRAMPDPRTSRERIPVGKGVRDFEERTVSLRALHTVMNARLKEIFEVVRQHVDEQGCLPLLGGGVVLTGGGAYVPGLAELAANVFGTRRCEIGTIRGVSGLEDLEQPAQYAAAAGLIMHGFESSAAEESTLTGIGRAIRRFLPWS